MEYENHHNIRINERYLLSPLLSVNKEDITPLFARGKGVYICNYPDQNWYELHKFNRKINYSIEKKTNMFNLMNPGSIILSPTQDSYLKKPTHKILSRNVIHLGSMLTGRMAQFHFTLQIIKWLFINRRKYNYCLIYNFYPSEMVAGLFARYCLRKKIIVDFEDDYLLKLNKIIYNIYFHLVKNIPSDIICINENMKKYFPKQNTYIFNGFIDLTYTKQLDFSLKSGSKFLYSGALDKIRGIDLIPDVVNALKKRINNFSICITGSGPLESVVKNWDIEEVKFLGFLTPIEYEKILDQSDFFLVLQKPDHPFTLGSFPSKIESYSKYKKPIYRIVLLND